METNIRESAELIIHVILGHIFDAQSKPKCCCFIGSMEIDLSDKQTVTGVILAGGRGRRMDERDKGLIYLEQRPLIEYVIEAISPQVTQLLINANRSESEYRRYGLPVISDQITGYVGPLAGMAAAMQVSNSDFVVSVPCDTPWVPHDLVSRLKDKLEREQADVCVAHDGERMHPVFALIRSGMADSLETYLNTGARAVHRWCQQQKLAIADFSDQPEAFINVNTPEELAAAARYLQASRKHSAGL